MKGRLLIGKSAFFHVALPQRESSNRTTTLRRTVGMPEIRSFSPFPATKTFFSITLSTNVCLHFKSRLRAYFDFRSKAQRLSTPLHSKIQRKTQPNGPLKDLFFAPKSYRFYVPKMSLKNANGCSVCAWLLTSGGLRPAMQLRRIAALALRARAPTKRTHCTQINRPLDLSIFYRAKVPKAGTHPHDEKRGGERSRPR